MLVVHSWYSICIRLFPMLFIHLIVMSLCRACPVCAVSTILLLPHCFWVPLQVSTCTHSHISSLKSVKMQRNLLIIITMPLTISIGFNVMLYCYIWVVNFKICITAAPLYLCYILFSCFYRSSLGEYKTINNKKNWHQNQPSKQFALRIITYFVAFCLSLPIYCNVYLLLMMCNCDSRWWQDFDGTAVLGEGLWSRSQWLP